MADDPGGAVDVMDALDAVEAPTPDPNIVRVRRARRAGSEAVATTDLGSRGAYVVARSEADPTRRRNAATDRTIGASTGALIVAAAIATVVLSHVESWSTASAWAVTWTVTVVVAVVVVRLLGRREPATVSRRNTRLGRRRRRNAFVLSAAACAAASAAVLVVLGRAATAVLPGVLAAVAVAVVARDRTSVAPTRPRGWALIAVALLAVPVVFSLGSTYTEENPDPLTIRSVEWLRDNGGAWLVDAVENWWYTNHPPPVGGTPSTLPRAPSTVPQVTTPVVADARQPLPPPGPPEPPPVTLHPVLTPAAPVLPGEGQWTVTAGTPARPAVATTWVRPDALHTSVVVGILRIDPALTRLRLIAGTEQPGGPAPSGGAVPLEDRASLVAAFNAGFRMKDSKGGWSSEGLNPWPLRDGAASLVFRDDGRADVGVWGREITLDPHITAVRQNLALLVDNGQLVPGTDDSSSWRWGGTVGNKVLVNRSGVGITADGAIVYVGGPALSVATLGQTLIAAGAVRGMELDINSAWVTAFTYVPTPNGPLGSKLIDAMPYGPERYLRSQGRDFISVTLAGPRA